MNQSERQIYLIKELLKEMPRYRGLQIPDGEEEGWQLLRSLFNVRPPYPASPDFLRVQDEYLSEKSDRGGLQTQLCSVPQGGMKESSSGREISPRCAVMLSSMRQTVPFWDAGSPAIPASTTSSTRFPVSSFGSGAMRSWRLRAMRRKPEPQRSLPVIIFPAGMCSTP